MINGLSDAGAATVAAIGAALDNVFYENGNPDGSGKIYLSDLNRAIGDVAGTSGYILEQPAANIVLGTGELPIRGGKIHMSHYSLDDYARALRQLLPPGRAWPRDTDSVHSRTLRALARSFQSTDSAAELLLTGSFPPTATTMLPEWESSLGLPDDCAISEIDSIAKRQAAVVSKLTSTGDCRRDILSRWRPRWAIPSPSRCFVLLYVGCRSVVMR